MNAYEARKMSNDYYLNAINKHIEEAASEGRYKVVLKYRFFNRHKPCVTVDELKENGFSIRLFIDEDFDYDGIIEDFNMGHLRIQPMNINCLGDYNGAVKFIEKYEEEHNLDDFAVKWARIEISW